MSIIRNRANMYFVIVPRELILDHEISTKAKFLYLYLSCKLDYSKFTFKSIMQDMGIVQRQTMWKWFRELRDAGWISRVKIQGADGLFGKGDEFVLHEIKLKDTGEEIKRSSFYNLFEKEEKGYHTIEMPEPFLPESYYDNLLLETAQTSEHRWFLIENKFETHSYTSELLFTSKPLLDKGYMVKRYKDGTKFKDFMFLGTDIKHVNLTEYDIERLRETYTPDKIRKMILKLDEWFSMPENEKVMQLMRGKSCMKYFEKRQWLEEKVRQELIAERNRHEKLKERNKD